MIMLGLGISLRKEDFKQLFDQPKPLAIGLSAQMLLLPLIAFLLVYKSNLAPELKVGAMILSVCPGGITSNLVSYFVKGNVALAVSLTVSNAFLSLFSIPLMINSHKNGSEKSLFLKLILKNVKFLGRCIHGLCLA